MGGGTQPTKIVGGSVQADRHSSFGRPPCQKSFKKCSRGLGLYPQASGVVSIFLIVFDIYQEKCTQNLQLSSFLQVIPPNKGANFIFCGTSRVKKKTCNMVDVQSDQN